MAVVNNANGYSEYSNYYKQPYDTSALGNIRTPNQTTQNNETESTQNTSPVGNVSENTSSGQSRISNISFDDLAGSFGSSAVTVSFGNQDVQSALNDMKKDSILEEYQYFVGAGHNAAPGVISSDKDGTVIKL